MSEDRTKRHALSRKPVGALRVEITKGPDAGRSFVASSDITSIGTASDNHVVLTDETVSRYHAELRHLGDWIEIHDLGSTNGTAVGRVLIEHGRLLSGATITLGRTTLRIEDGSPLELEHFEGDELLGVIGRSEPMQRLLAQVRRAAQSDVSVLLTGETGVGKEVIARAIHLGSARASGPLETVDCGALAPSLVASELFGYEKGSFTGADRRYAGAFERAEGGTILLDEIGELPAALQTTLLGVLERRSFRRVGGDKPIQTNLRLVAATHRDLREEVNAGTFREDLYYRVAVVRLHIPALRERREDIPLLIEHFLREAGFAGPIQEVISPDELDRMMEHRWPGNVRELRNTVEAALAMGEVPPLQHGRTKSASAEEGPASEVAPSWPREELLDLPYKEARRLVLDEFETRYVTRLLDQTNHNVSAAAGKAKINRTYLNEMLKRLQIR